MPLAWLVVMMAPSELWCQLNEIMSSDMRNTCLFVFILILIDGERVEQVASHTLLGKCTNGFSQFGEFSGSGQVMGSYDKQSHTWRRYA